MVPVRQRTALGDSPRDISMSCSDVDAPNSRPYENSLHTHCTASPATGIVGFGQRVCSKTPCNLNFWPTAQRTTTYHRDFLDIARYTIFYDSPCRYAHAHVPSRAGNQRARAHDALAPRARATDRDREGRSAK